MNKSFSKTFLFTIMVLVVILTLFTCTTNNENNWLQFRGSGANGIASENAIPPTHFSQEENVLWKAETPEGYSSPCIINDNLILTGVNRKEKKYLIWNINSDDGSIKWQKEIAVDTLEKGHPINSPAAATTASDGEYIYCFFPTFGLVCFDFDGNKIWESPVHFYPAFMGSGTSPIVYKDKVILNHDNLENPRLLVFNKSNGEPLWEHQFPKRPLISSTSWSTPVIWENQVVIHRINEIVGFDIDTGKPIWKFDIGTTGCATPVVVKDTLYVNAWMVRGEKALEGGLNDFQKLFTEIDINSDSNLTKNEIKEKYPKGIAFYTRPEGQDIGSVTLKLRWRNLKEFDLNKDTLLSQYEWEELLELMIDYSNHGLVAIQLGDTGNITLSAKLWKVKENIPETPSVLVNKGLVYMVKNGGIATCVDAQSGEIVYSEKLKAPGSYLASPLCANGLIFIPAFNGKITIIKEGKNLEVVNQVDLDEKIGASPVAIEDKLYIRTKNHLYAFGEN